METTATNEPRSQSKQKSSLTTEDIYAMEEIFNQIRTKTDETDEGVYKKIMEQSFDRLYELLGLAGYGIAGILLTLTSIERTYYYILEQYHLNKFVTFTAPIIGGVIMSFVGLGIVYGVKIRHERTTYVKAQKSLQETSSMLRDLIKKLESKKIIRKSSVEQSERGFLDETNLH